MPLNDRSIELYYKRRDRCKVKFPCPRCNKTLSSKEYETHSKPCLQLNPTLQCVWCLGKVSWEQKTKHRHVNHLLECWKKFIDTSPVESFDLFDMVPACPEKDFFGRTKLPGLYPKLYETIFVPNDEWWPQRDTLRFSNENLNLAADCVRKFLDTRESSEWFHLQVHVVAWNSFREAMEADRGVSVLLPFWCLCDGGPDKEACHRQHRHLIVVSPKGHFKKYVWKNVKVSEGDRPYKDYKSIFSTLIDSPRYLINTIGYLSNRKSECNISADSKTNLNHFYINIPLPEKFKWTLACLWNDGLMQLINQECKYLHPDKLAPCAKFISGQWKVYVKDLPKIPKNLVLPVCKHFIPTTKPTNYYLHLAKGKKLYFEKDDRQLDEHEWGQLQATLGNIFCKAVENEFYSPSVHQRKHFATFQVLIERIAELENENKALKFQMHTEETHPVGHASGGSSE